MLPYNDINNYYKTNIYKQPFTSTDKTIPKTARILTQSEQSGSGLDTDVEIYQKLLYKAGFVHVYHRKLRDSVNLDNEPIVTLNLFLEHTRRSWMKKARFNYFMVNQEIHHSTADYLYLDCIIVKTWHAQDIVTWYKNSLI